MPTDDEDRPADPNGSEPVGEYVRIYRRADVWYANYQAGRKQHRVPLKTTNKKRAEAKARRIDTDLAAGRWKPATEAASVEAAIAAYKEKVRADDLAPKTMAEYEMLLKRLAALAAGRAARDLSRLDRAFVDADRAARAKAGAKPETVYGETIFLRQLVKFALPEDGRRRPHGRVHAEEAEADPAAVLDRGRGGEDPHRRPAGRPAAADPLGRDGDAVRRAAMADLAGR
jgi:hypothetical protein